MKPQYMIYGDFIKRLFPDGDKKAKTFTFQVTEACSLCCTYCYQINKTPHQMDFNIAKKTIDYLFDNRKNPDFYFCEDTTEALIIDFIGGEPLLEIDLITQIIDYFESKFLENLDCPWTLFHKYSFSSNGVDYFNPKVQALLKKYKSLISMSITLDGCKELHDQCRLFPNGQGSYDIACKAALDQLYTYGNNSTKITIAPENVSYLYKGFVNMIDLGFTTILANCAFEEGWKLCHAQEFFKQLTQIADYIVDNQLENKIYFALLDAEKYHAREEDRNWCGSTDCMLAVDYQGDLYPCIRFMASSLGNNIEPYKIGNINSGLAYDKNTKEKLEYLGTITCSSQSSQECLDCPIDAGCSWCSGYNYQKFGTINHRATYICQMHKAGALASKYFYKKCKDKIGYDLIKVNDLIALEILSQEEWDKIKSFKEE